MPLTLHRFCARDKTPLSYWASEVSPDGFDAVVQLVHGAGEHAACYDEFAEFLRQNRIAFFGLDLRGYGRSGGPRAWVREFGDYGSDVLALSRIIQGRCPRMPLFLLGHSMGGLIAAQVAAGDSEGAFAGLLLSAPCLGLPGGNGRDWISLAGFILTLPDLLGHPLYASTRFIRTHLAKDADWMRKRAGDSAMVERMSVKLYLELGGAARASVELARRIRIPTLMMLACEDRVVANRYAELFFEGLPGAKKEKRVFEDSFHEILHDRERGMAYARCADFIRRHLSSKMIECALNPQEKTTR